MQSGGLLNTILVLVLIRYQLMRLLGNDFLLVDDSSGPVSTMFLPEHIMAFN